VHCYKAGDKAHYIYKMNATKTQINDIIKQQFKYDFFSCGGKLYDTPGEQSDYTQDQANPTI